MRTYAWLYVTEKLAGATVQDAYCEFTTSGRLQPACEEEGDYGCLRGGNRGLDKHEGLFDC